jgi:hypothetical protein
MVYPEKVIPLRLCLLGRLHLENENKWKFILHFARFALPLHVLITKGMPRQTRRKSGTGIYHVILNRPGTVLWFTARSKLFSYFTPGWKVFFPRLKGILRQAERLIPAGYRFDSSRVSGRNCQGNHWLVPGNPIVCAGESHAWQSIRQLFDIESDDRLTEVKQSFDRRQATVWRQSGNREAGARRLFKRHCSVQGQWLVRRVGCFAFL